MPAEADPDLAMRLAKATVDVYADAAQRLLQLVARRLAQGVDQPGWAERKLLELLQLRDDAVAVLDEIAVLGERAARQAVTDAYEHGARAAATEMGATFGRVHAAAVDAYIQELVIGLEATRLQVLRSVLDAYRQVIAEVAAPGVLTGTMTRRQAAQRALDRFAARGIRGFTDTAGRQWELESYAEMATRTAVGRAQVQGTLDRYRVDGRHLVIITDAPQECRACRPWEGKVLSIDGTGVGDELEGGFVVAGTIDQARAAGLFHANCRHRANAFVSGLTRPMTHTADPDGDRVRQEQRRLERGVRHWKRREAAAIDDDGRRRAAVHVRDWQARLRAHVQANDLKRLRAREQIGSAR